jgi:hypothetical protein
MILTSVGTSRSHVGAVIIELNSRLVTRFECNRHVMANAKRYVEARA